MHVNAHAAELQACASAASEKIGLLEEEAEATQKAHEQAIEGLQAELQTAKVCACSWLCAGFPILSRCQLASGQIAA